MCWSAIKKLLTHSLSHLYVATTLEVCTQILCTEGHMNIHTNLSTLHTDKKIIKFVK